MTMIQKTTLETDRRDEERRRDREFVEFPFKDSSGVEVKFDRRKSDRRSKVTVTSEDISDTEFNQHFYPPEEE